jgi:hypothetical protein
LYQWLNGNLPPIPCLYQDMSCETAQEYAMETSHYLQCPLNGLVRLLAIGQIYPKLDLWHFKAIVKLYASICFCSSCRAIIVTHLHATGERKRCLRHPVCYCGRGYFDTRRSYSIVSVPILEYRCSFLTRRLMRAMAGRIGWSLMEM